MTTYPVKNHRLADSASLGDFWPFSSASGRSYTSGHVDNSSLHPRCGLALQEPSCDEPPVRESLADRRINKTVQPSRRMVFNIAFVEAKSELIDIAEQMLARVGCFPCINSRKREIKLISIHFPERIDMLERAEAGIEPNVLHSFFARKTVPPRFRTHRYTNRKGIEFIVASIR